MPGDPFSIYGSDAARSQRQAAWTAHYAAKGCNRFKASELARRKVGRKATWPPP